jgi:hypothetical protein
LERTADDQFQQTNQPVGKWLLKACSQQLIDIRGQQRFVLPALTQPTLDVEQRL